MAEREGIVPDPRASRLAIGIACLAAGAVVGGVAASSMVVSDLTGDAGSALEFFVVLIGGALVFALPGAFAGAAAGLVVSPLAMRFRDRDRLLRRIVVAALSTLPVAVGAGLLESPVLTLPLMVAAAVPIFLVVVLAPNRISRIGGVLLVWGLALTLAAPVLRYRHALPDDAQALIVRMGTDDAQLRERACRKLEHVAGVEGLLVALRDADSRVQLEAARRIQRYPTDEVRAALQVVLDRAIATGDEPLEWIARHSLEEVSR